MKCELLATSLSEMCFLLMGNLLGETAGTRPSLCTVQEHRYCHLLHFSSSQHHSTFQQLFVEQTPLEIHTDLHLCSTLPGLQVVKGLNCLLGRKGRFEMH